MLMDLVIVTADKNWKHIEQRLNSDLKVLKTYYHQKRLTLSKEKTVYSMFVCCLFCAIYPPDS